MNVSTAVKYTTCNVYSMLYVISAVAVNLLDCLCLTVMPELGLFPLPLHVNINFIKYVNKSSSKSLIY